jgi:hypothetical protein
MRAFLHKENRIAYSLSAMYLSSGGKGSKSEVRSQKSKQSEGHKKEKLSEVKSKEIKY